MIKKIVRRIKKMLFVDNNSHLVSDAVIERFTADPDFPYLISFPRTGSHWLRNVMELYFEKPSLARIFYYPGATDFTCYHRHDVDLSISCRKVIYLYRNPVDTVYSQMRYHKESLDNEERIQYWSQIYMNHLKKWLFDETCTVKKTVITYEAMKSDMNGVFTKLCDFFGVAFDEAKLMRAMSGVTKESVKSKTGHDPSVINVKKDYDTGRANFKERYGDMILNIVCYNDELTKEFKG